MPSKPDTVPPDSLKRFCLYRRVSDQDQVDKDLSLPAQQRAQQEYVVRAGGVVTHEFEDGGVSGTRTAGRDGFQNAVAAAKAREYDILLIHKSDRVFRNRFDAVTYKVMLREYGVALASVTEAWVGGDEPGEQLLEGIMECVNEFYSANLSREIKKGMREAAMQGRGVGIIPFGYAFVNPEVQGAGWKVNEKEAAIVRMLFQRILDGLTMADIARELNALGLPTPSACKQGRAGKPRPSMGWRSNNLHQVITNRTYLGEIWYQGESFPGKHPAIITPETFHQVQSILTTRAPRRAEASERGLFVGALLRCPLCGSPLVHMTEPLTRGEHQGPKGSKYACSEYRRRLGRQSAGIPIGDAVCSGFALRQSIVLRLLTEHLQASAARQSPAGSLSQAAAALAVHLPTPAPLVQTGDERKQIESALEKMSVLRAGFQAQAAEGLMTLPELRTRLDTLAERRTALEASLEKIEAAAAPPPRLTPAIAAGLLTVLQDTTLTVRQQRDRLRLAIDHMIINPEKTAVKIVLRSRLQEVMT